MPQNNTLTSEELEALTKDLQEVLAKHGAEMGITSTINLTKTSVPSPYGTNSGEEAKKEESNQTEPETEASSQEGSQQSS